MVSKIERIIGGVVINTVQPNDKGIFECLPKGQNIDPVQMRTLDEVADWLRTHPEGGVRMNPGWTKLSLNIYIDSIPR